MTGRPLRFWVHDPRAPSFRHRLAAAVPALERRGFSCETQVFPRTRYGVRVLERARGLARVDLLVVAKLKLLPGETALVRRRARCIVYDFDDAIYVGKPDFPGDDVDRSRFRLAKFRATCRMADLVVAGSEELARAARPFARRVEVVPTGVDLARFPAHLDADAGSRPLLVWIGLPGNVAYLEEIRPALARLTREIPDLTLRVVSSRSPEWPVVRIESVPWSEATEAEALGAAAIGVMPLPDDEWTRGKAGFKLLQYMAAGLPCVASPVGSNREIVVDGATGRFAADPDGWYAALRDLLASEETRREMGRAGRRRVEERYTLDRVAARTADVYASLSTN